MNRKIVKLSCLTLTLMIVLSSVVALNNVAAQGRSKVFVDPPVNEFLTSTTPLGTSFTVSIKAADWVDPGVYGYQLNFAYDASMLQFVSAAIPAGTHWFTPVDPTKIFIVDAGSSHNDTTPATVSFAVSLLNPELAKTGGGVIATITLKIITAPGIGANLTSLLQLTDVIMVDPTTGLGYPLSSFDNVPATFNYVSPPPPKPTIKVSNFVWDNTAADAAGRLFNITVSIEGLAADWHAVAFEFRLSFDKTLISTKTEWVFAGDFIAAFGLEAGGTFNITFGEEDNVLFGEIILPPWADPAELDKWAHGSGVLATIQFSADYIPPPVAECDLALSDIVIVDYQGNDVPSTAVSGTYKITVAAPPWLSVDPQTATFNTLGAELNLNAVLNSIDKGFRLVGAEFKMRYNTTFLTISEITEGTFMKGFAQGAGTDTFFQSYVQEDYGLIGIIILPLPDGTWPDSVFPEGTGTLATLKFTSIYQDAVLDLSTSITVFDGLLVDVDAKEILIDQAKTTQFGTCQCTLTKAFVAPPIPAPDRVVDVFTQYDRPYGGQGAGVPSDAFAPQGQVNLFANVTYRGEGIPNKPVAYQIRGPNGDYLFDTRFSGADGLALLGFSIPASEAYFGIWNVTASVDIAGQTVTDYVFFRVGWLVSTKAISVTSDGSVEDPPGSGTQYPLLIKGNQYTIDSILKVITMQPPEKCVQLQGQIAKVLLAYTGFDELGQAILSQYAPMFIGYFDDASATVAPKVADMVNFVLSTGRDFGTGTSTISIPRSAFSGIGTIYGNVFTEFPWVQGVPYAPPALGAKKVWIKAVAAPPKPARLVGSLSVLNTTITSGKTGSVSVAVGSIDADAHIVAVQFSVRFDKTVLDVVNATVGSFVPQFGGAYITWQLDGDVLVGVLQLPPWPGTNGWMTGGGTLADIEFKAKAANAGTFLTIIPSETFLVGADGTRFDLTTLQAGFVWTVG